ncbi:MAG: hypothetical protein GEU79_06055 [Acidimicrobiia bacterium]|nr:hypothetical protein [Acidimicrobiia bacterium]
MAIGVSYFGNRILRHVRSDMEDLRDRGFTGVLHTFSENDLNWYRAQMGQIVAVSHEVGLEVQLGPWGIGHLFGGEAESLFMTQNPELGQVFADGRRVGAACPSRPEVAQYLKGWIEAAVETGADRIFWDEPHWAHPVRFNQPDDAWTCVCEVCRHDFRELFGEEMVPQLTEEVRAFREQVLVGLLTDLVAHVESLGCRSTICLLPTVDGIHAVDSWEEVAAVPHLDTLATDPYWSFFDRDADEWVGEQAGRIVELAARHNTTPQIWIQGFGLSPDQAEEIHAAVNAARRAGVEDLWTWGFEACGHMSYLETKQPDVVWEILTEALTGS